MEILKAIDRLERFLKLLLSDSWAWFKPLYEKEEETMEKLNAGQLFEGYRADDSPIEPEYTDKTKWFKMDKGQPIDRVTLKDTGYFHSSIFAEVENDGILFGATDPKTESLLEKYDQNEQLLNLSDNHVEFLNEEIILPNAIKEMDKDLKKIMK